MAVERGAMVGGAPRAERHLSDAGVLSGADELAPEVKVPGAGARERDTTPQDDLRSNFIAVHANAYSTMYYDVRWRDVQLLGQGPEPAPQNASGGASPAGMEQT